MFILGEISDLGLSAHNKYLQHLVRIALLVFSFIICDEHFEKMSNLHYTFIE